MSLFHKEYVYVYIYTLASLLQGVADVAGAVAGVVSCSGVAFCKNSHQSEQYRSFMKKSSTEGRRLIECLIFIAHFPQKSPINSVSFAQNDLQPEFHTTAGTHSQKPAYNRVAKTHRTP